MDVEIEFDDYYLKNAHVFGQHYVDYDLIRRKNIPEEYVEELINLHSNENKIKNLILQALKNSKSVAEYRGRELIDVPEYGDDSYGYYIASSGEKNGVKIEVLKDDYNINFFIHTKTGTDAKDKAIEIVDMVF